MNLGWNNFGWTEMKFEKLCQIIKTKRNDIQRQSEKTKEKKIFSLILEYETRMGEKNIHRSVQYE